MTKTWELGLVGYPLGHSLSPRLHTTALRVTGLTGAYRLYPIPPTPADTSALRVLLDRVRRGEIDGLNVTIPYKQSVISLLDDLTPLARAIGAVNTIYRAGDTLVGDNTDAPAFLADLESHLPFLILSTLPNPQSALRTRTSPNTDAISCVSTSPTPSALVLGSGGSARAVAFALAQAGWAITIAARRREQARELLHSLLESRPGCRLAWIDLNRLSLQLEPPPTLIVNCTPVGMAPQTDASPWPTDCPFPSGAFLYDLVYNPSETTLVRLARLAGRKAVTGLGMLIEQAALAFARWTGVEAPRHTMRASVQEKPHGYTLRPPDGKPVAAFLCRPRR